MSQNLSHFENMPTRTHVAIVMPLINQKCSHARSHCMCYIKIIGFITNNLS